MHRGLPWSCRTLLRRAQISSRHCAVQRQSFTAQCVASDHLSPQEIERRIEETRARREKYSANRVACPGCACFNFSPEKLWKHMRTCCPDLLADERDWELLQTGASTDGVNRLLAHAVAKERGLRAEAIRQAFHQVDEDGNPLIRTPADFAGALGLPEPRCARVLRNAIKDTPMPGDPEPIEILFEDDVLIAVNKPPFLRSQPIHRHRGGSVLNRLITYFGSPPHVIHRLDMNTSGVLLFAKTPDVVPCVHKQFRRREVRKEYLAVGMGRPLERTFQVNVPLQRHPSIDAAMCVSASGKASETAMEVVSSSQSACFGDWVRGKAWTSPPETSTRGASLIVCRPHTGRTHQIRVHLAAVGHGILGDEVYGVSGPWIARQALHAAALTMMHPTLKSEITIRAPIPQDMHTLIERCGLSIPPQML